MAFLKKTRKALRRNLSMAENLLDFLITTNLLSTYLWFSMKHTEAIHEGNGKPLRFLALGSLLTVLW
jgi:hypothetical protein